MSKEPMEGNWMSTPAADENEGTKFNGEGGSRKVHQFYFVKFWPYKDPEKDSKLEWSRQQCEQLDQEKKLVVDDKMKEIMSRGENIYSELERKRYRSAVLGAGVEWKTMVVGFLQAAMDKLIITAPSSSKQPAIHSPHTLVTHGSNNLAKEEQLSKKTPSAHQPQFLMSSLRNEIGRAYFWYSQSKNRNKFEQILKEIEEIEDRHDKAKADSAAKGNIWNPLSSKKAIEDQIRLLNKIPDELKPERCEVMEEIKCLENELKALKKEENVVSEKFQLLINRKSDLCDFVLAIRKEEDEANANYNEYVSLIRNVNELARNKDVKALEQLSSKQVDDFMRQWKDSQSLRERYEKTVLWSLHYREMSRDGRIRNDHEQPVLENGEIHQLFLHLVSTFLTLFLLLDVRNKMLH
ncbi:hypothetical protein ES332_D13G158200v1 [Gossypium tomentosum]|uniref:Proton pump-interactor 1 n=1 Tax=Gossypium tomentosum TaxID=34277 RepID=A0A5D2HZI0_GOSTO|nr:hypothetical protein ES332_D13G158200v1 [Gossypium tomentosum]